MTHDSPTDSLWTSTFKDWAPVFEGLEIPERIEIDPAEVNRRFEERYAEQVKPFRTPVNPGTLNVLLD